MHDDRNNFHAMLPLLESGSVDTGVGHQVMKTWKGMPPELRQYLETDDSSPSVLHCAGYLLPAAARLDVLCVPYHFLHFLFVLVSKSLD